MMQKMPLKLKVILLSFMIFFMLFYMFVFGQDNSVIGMTIAMAAFMNANNDLSYKPKLSFVKVLSLLLILGIVSYLNNPISILGCILTFFVVFGTTFSSYHLFKSNVYIPYLMCYFMMMCIPVSAQELPMRLISLIFGAIFIVGFNLLVNRNKPQKLTKQTITGLVDEINNAVDLKLQGKEVSKESFKTANNFYSSLFSQFKYKYFPSPIQKSVINVVKSFQYIGSAIADFELSADELNYIKKLLANIENNNFEDVARIEVEHNQMYIILLNFENIVEEIKNADLTKEPVLPDKNTIKSLFKPIIKRSFSFRSVKFTFAFKMAFVLTLWEVLTLMFNLPYTKWLYFASISLMLPYVNDMSYNSMSRLKGTFIGAFVFAVIIIIMPYLPIGSNALMFVVLIVCMSGMVYNIEDKFSLSIFTTIMSIMVSIIYISPIMAIELKILWVFVAIIVVTAINFLFLPYSVEKETRNNLMVRSRLNKQSMGLIKEKFNIYKSTTIMVLSNIVGENVEITENNKELFEIQRQITDVSNFVLVSVNNHKLSKEFNDNLKDILNNGGQINDDLDIKSLIILYSVKYLMTLCEKEKELIRGL